MRKHQKTRRLLLPLLAGLFLMALFVKAPRAQAASFRAKGIDVSRWQGTVDWAKVKKSGVEFTMLGLGRLRGKTPEPDPRFKTNIQGALRQGIKVGVYLYSIAMSVEQARAEARYVLDQIDGYEISYPVAFDIEDPSQTRLSTKLRTDMTIAFLEVIEDAGYYPMIYASENWFRSSMDMSRLSKYDKWIANWSKMPSIRPLSMWQYSSTGRISGIPAAVDLDYSYKDYTKLIEPRKLANRPGDGAGWQTDGKNRWYVAPDGKTVKKAFRTINGKTYYFNAKGYPVTGWKTIDKKRYFFSASGVMKTGWLKKNGKNYYFDPETGVMATGWLTVDGNTYYLNSSGVRQAGCWLMIGGEYYYMDKKTGIMHTGWLELEGQRYYLTEKGKRVTGKKKIDGVQYSFDNETGVLLA